MKRQPTEMARQIGKNVTKTPTTIDRETLTRYINEGLSLTEMAERWQQEVGTRRARSSFAVAMSRYGMTSPHPQVRHEDTLPWTVKSKHSNEYPARMLRALGRRNKDMKIPPALGKRLDAYLQLLDEQGAVVAYDADTDQGFWHVKREKYDEGYIRAPEHMPK